jgi:galactitol-specific phosphotransferase system IIB component
MSIYVSLSTAWKHGDPKLDTMFRIDPFTDITTLTDVIKKKLDKHNLKWVTSGMPYNTYKASYDIADMILSGDNFETKYGSDFIKEGDYLFPVEIHISQIKNIVEIS